MLSQKDYQKNWEAQNKDRRKIINKRSRTRKRLWYKELKSKLSCSICGESEPICLTFHHKDSHLKDKEVSSMIGQCYGEQRILNEINKCIVLCSNCHAKVTAGLISIKSDATIL